MADAGLRGLGWKAWEWEWEWMVRRWELRGLKWGRKGREWEWGRSGIDSRRQSCKGVDLKEQGGMRGRLSR